MNYPKPKKLFSPSSQKITEKATLEDNHKSFVTSQVIEAVGKIDDMKKIKASNVFDNNWRVDIWCESETEGCLIPRVEIRYSYFVRTDKEGNIIKSSPELGAKCN